MTSCVLITGGGGFIGSHLVESQLEHGYRVRTVDLHTDRLAHLRGRSNLEIVKGDITEDGLLERLVEGVDVVYHLASAHLDVSLGEDHYRKVNVDATVNLIRRARKACVTRFIHCSTNGVYGKLENLPANEDSPRHPTNIYGKTKLAGELAALGLANEIGLPLVVVRPSWVYGPGCPRTEKLFRTVRKGRFVFFGDGLTLRHPVYISDLIKGMELCATAPNAFGEVFLIAGGETVNINDLVQNIAGVLGVRVLTLHLPVSLGMFASRLIELGYQPTGKQPPFSRRSLDFFLMDNSYDIRKAQKQLGFQPQVNLQAGLADTLHWMNHAGKDRTISGRLETGNG